MKHKIKTTLLALTVSIMTAFSLATFAEGGVAGGGGDSCAQEFIHVARELLDQLVKEYPNNLQKIDLAKFDSVINAATVVCIDTPLVLNGIVKEAVNTPSENKIMVNRQSWNAIQNPRKKTALSFHEYLGLMGVDDQTYRLSSLFLGGGEIAYITEPSSFVAKPGSALEYYDNEVKELNSMTSSSEIKTKSVAILQKYFGFSEVKFASWFGMGTDWEIGMAKFLATHLRDTLPADFNTYSYVGIDTRKVQSSGAEILGAGRFDGSKEFIVVFDGDRDGISIDVTVDDNGDPSRVKYPSLVGPNTRVERYTMKVGAKRFLLHTGRFKPFFSLLMNYGNTHYSPNLDIPVH